MPVGRAEAAVRMGLLSMVALWVARGGSVPLVSLWPLRLRETCSIAQDSKWQGGVPARGDLEPPSRTSQPARPQPLMCCIIHKPHIPPGVNIQKERFKSTCLLGK